MLGMSGFLRVDCRRLLGGPFLGDGVGVVGHGVPCELLYPICLAATKRSKMPLQNLSGHTIMTSMALSNRTPNQKPHAYIIIHQPSLCYAVVLKTWDYQKKL